MKAYPLTDGDLSEIGSLRGVETTCFSASTFALGLLVNIFVTTYIATLPQPEFLLWKIGMWALAILTAGLLIAGIYFHMTMNSAIRRLKKQTTFDA